MKGLFWPVRALWQPIWTAVYRLVLILRMHKDMVLLSGRGMKQRLKAPPVVTPVAVLQENFQAAWSRAADPVKATRNLRAVAMAAWFIGGYALTVGMMTPSGGAILSGVMIFAMAILVFHYPLWQVETQAMHSYGRYLRTLPYEPGLLWRGLICPLPAKPVKEAPHGLE